MLTGLWLVVNIFSVEEINCNMKSSSVTSQMEKLDNTGSNSSGNTNLLKITGISLCNRSSQLNFHLFTYLSFYSYLKVSIKYIFQQFKEKKILIEMSTIENYYRIVKSQTVEINSSIHQTRNDRVRAVTISFILIVTLTNCRVST